MSGKRKAISTRTRFNVFKRDKFTCVYCGRTPPTVVLEVDHVHPVAEGGTNEITNLVAACEDCNAGKSNKLLTQTPQTVAELRKRQKEIAKQVEDYNAFLREMRTATDAVIESLGRYWFDKFREPGGFVFGPARTPSIKTFLSRLTEVEIEDAMDIAFARIPPRYDNDHKTFKYFCGVCWNKIRARDGGAE